MYKIKQKLYLDTSIFNFIIAENDIEKRDITIEFFKKISQIGEIFISPVVTREVEETEESIRKTLIEILNRYKPTILELNEEIRSLAKEYIKANIIPPKYEDDVLHIAAAVVYQLDVIVSWNFDHIVKLKTRREVNGLNKILGYKEIEICSPQEVI